MPDATVINPKLHLCMIMTTNVLLAPSSYPNTLGIRDAPYFDYRDFSNFPDPDPSKPLVSDDRQVNFPTKLFQILSRPEYEHIISWMPHGRSWKIHRTKEFVSKVIPKFFGNTKYSSFVRQANGWGFRRLLENRGDENSYYHELFLRGKPHLIKILKRGNKNNKPRSECYGMQPDLYAISKEHPLPASSGKSPDCDNAGAIQSHHTLIRSDSFSADGAASSVGVSTEDFNALPHVVSLPTLHRGAPDSESGFIPDVPQSKNAAPFKNAATIPQRIETNKRRVLNRAGALHATTNFNSRGCTGFIVTYVNNGVRQSTKFFPQSDNEDPLSPTSATRTIASFLPKVPPRTSVVSPSLESSPPAALGKITSQKSYFLPSMIDYNIKNDDGVIDLHTKEASVDFEGCCTLSNGQDPFEEHTSLLEDWIDDKTDFNGDEKLNHFSSNVLPVTSMDVGCVSLEEDAFQFTSEDFFD